MIELFASPGVYGQKVRIVLEETGLPYAHTVTPSLRDPHGPDGLPLLIAESAAIALYLARKAQRLGPESERERAAFDHWAHAISSTLSPLFAVHAYFKAHGGDATALFESTVQKTLHTFEEHMATRHFMIGERFTVIDALLYPHLATSASALTGDLAGFPNLARYRERMGQREAVRRAMR
jgi:GSH-dependent disulfide-bond oxidoreductase